jgi:hypothetical protein
MYLVEALFPLGMRHILKHFSRNNFTPWRACRSNRIAMDLA